MIRPPTGLYLHVPFCEARCSYCAFATWTDRSEQQDAYFAALEREAGLRARGAELQTVYFGGGTPSLPDPRLLARILERVGAEARVAGDAEVTLEVNPESCDERRAEAWRLAGFNRASVGVQSFDPDVLREAGRLHGPEGPPRAVAALRSAGFENVSIDLIAGLPHETAASLRDSRRRALELEPEHVSLYLLELDEAGKASPLAAAVRGGRVRVATDDELADWYEESVEDLERHGLARYEISNFAREGRRSRHNLKYWRCEPVAAAGVAAHWFDGERRRFNVTGFEAYARLVAAGGDAEAEESRSSPPADVAQERLIMGLRLSDGVDLGALEAEHPGARRRFQGVLSGHAAAGLLETRGATVRLTGRGMLLSNEVFRDVLTV